MKMVEMVSRKRGEKEVPWMWIPKKNLKDAYKEYKISLEQKVSAIAGKQGMKKEEVRKKYNLEEPTIDEFTEMIWKSPESQYEVRGLERSPSVPNYEELPPTVLPWSRSRGYIEQTLLKQESLIGPKPRPKPGELNDILEKMEYGHGLRILWDDFGAGEEISTSRQVTQDIQQQIDRQGIPEYPGVEPEQVGIMIKTPGIGRTKKYELAFTKHSEYAGTTGMYQKFKTKIPKQPRQIIDGNIWVIPKALKRDDSYPLSRAILGTQSNIRTYGYSPTEIYKLIPAE